MSITMEGGIKRWTAKRKSALVVEIIQGKTTVAEASRAFDRTPSEIEGWVEDAKKGMENALRTNPLDGRQQYEKRLRELQEAYGEAVLELRARKSWQALEGDPIEMVFRWEPRSGRTTIDPDAPRGPSRRRCRRAADEALRLVWRAKAHGLRLADEGAAEGRSASPSRSRS